MPDAPSSPGALLGRALDAAGAGSAHAFVVLAPPGVGKTALLVHAGVEALQAGGRVLHVAVADTVDHVRRHYDAVIAAHGPTDVAARMIHSDRSLTVQRLEGHLTLLGEAAGFRPTLIAVDGLSGEAGGVGPELVAYADLARRIGARLWVSTRQDGAPGFPDGALGILLATEGGVVRPRLMGPDGERSLDLALTPDGVLEPVREGVGDGARLQAASVTLFTGGAAGAEAAFGQLAERWGLTEVNFTFPGHVQARTRGAVELSERELKAGDVSLAYVSRRLQRTYSTEGTLIRKVLQTLWQMVSRSQKVLVVGAIQADGTVVGGTGWSVELARMWNKDLWVYDQDRQAWFTWSASVSDDDATDGRWVPGECRIDATRIAGTGTRYLQPHAQAALEELFERSFS